MTYFEYLNTIKGEQLLLHKEYHDNHFGYPLDKDNELFGRMNTGYLPGAHGPECPVYKRIMQLTQKK